MHEPSKKPEKKLKASETVVLRTITIDPSNKTDYVDGWLKIELTGASAFTLKVSQEESKSAPDATLKPADFLAVSTEPKKNDKTKILQVQAGKELRINETEGTIYIKYPYEQEYLLSLRHMNKDRSS